MLDGVIIQPKKKYNKTREVLRQERVVDDFGEDSADMPL
jgi:hypothetical protein